MNDYNAKIVHEQGSSVLRIDSAGSISIQAGGKLDNAGDVSATGSVTIVAGGAFFFGDSQFLFATTNSVPTATASPGSLFLRSDGSMSRLYVNTSDGQSGSVWGTASELA